MARLICAVNQLIISTVRLPYTTAHDTIYLAFREDLGMRLMSTACTVTQHFNGGAYLPYQVIS